MKLRENTKDESRNVALRNTLAEAILNLEKEEFTINDLCFLSKLKKTTIRKYVKTLVESGALAIVKKGRGKASETKYILVE